MADEPTFAQQQVTEELSESDRIRKRIQDYKAQLSPNTLQVIQILLDSQLKSGLIKPADLDAIVMLRDEVNKASIDYSTQVQNAQRRLEELSATETAEKVAAEEAKIQAIVDSRDAERARRKGVEDRLAQMEAVLASHGISMDLNQDGVVGLKEGQVADELTEEEQEQVDDMIQVEKENITTEPSRAFQMARALNPEPDMPPPDPMESWDKPAVSDEQMEEAVKQIEQEEFEEKVAETKKSFKEWDEQNKQESFDFKPSGTTTESFMDEVERVNEVAEADEILEDEPQSSAPVVSAGQVNEVQAEELAEENPEFVLHRESVRMIDEMPEQVEEEYEEVVIPSESELKSMTKSKINEQATSLGFDVPTTLTKSKMIESFLTQTDEFIQGLQDSGEFVSASDDSDGDDKTNIKDGGYF
tara:strand:- start:1055 stop:2302 length:1248 start_codon:yes stop_codon:yes gene_type:complete